MARAAEAPFIARISESLALSLDNTRPTIWSSLIKPFGNNGYCFPIDSKDSVYILMNDKYAVASNKFNNANGFLNGNFRTTKMPETASSQVIGHPIAFYLDVQEMAKNIDPNISESEKDKAMIMESKKLLTNIAFTGGAFNDGLSNSGTGNNAGSTGGDQPHNNLQPYITLNYIIKT